MEKLSSGALEHNPLEEKIINVLDMYVPSNWKNLLSNNNSRFEYYNHVNDYVSYGTGNEKFKLESQIMDITTGELHFLLGDGKSFFTDLRGNTLAKEINKVMNNLPNWEKSETIKRSYSGRGLKGFVRKLK